LTEVKLLNLLAYHKKEEEGGGEGARERAFEG
jgi:hypothetical protein